MRIAIIVGAVVVGAVVIAKGFPSSWAPPALEPTQTSTVTPTTRVTHPSTKPPKTTQGRQQRVEIGVYNATTSPRLAAVTAASLKRRFGYVLGKVTTALSPSAVTLIYYRDGAQVRADARLLQRVFYKKAKIQPLPSTARDVPNAVELAIVLGSDY